MNLKLQILWFFFSFVTNLTFKKLSLTYHRSCIKTILREPFKKTFRKSAQMRKYFVDFTWNRNMFAPNEPKVPRDDWLSLFPSPYINEPKWTSIRAARSKKKYFCVKKITWNCMIYWKNRTFISTVSNLLNYFC